MTNSMTISDKDHQIEKDLDFILEHLNDPLFPRTIMTKALGHQKEACSEQEALACFKASNYQDCRINAYPAYTEYRGINLTAPSFIMIDLDLKDFDHGHEQLDKTLYKTLNKINDTFHGARPTVLWTGNGYHIYQPISGLVFEEIDRFAQFIDSNKKDLTSRFMQFAEDFFTDNKGDRQHLPSIKSCLIRIPGTINSKCNQEVKIVQRWNRMRPQINYMLRDFRTWLVSEIIEDKRKEKLYSKRSKWTSNRVYHHGYTANSIPWIEKLLQTPIVDNRKYAIWRIIIPYLFNIQKLSDGDVINLLLGWLDKCNLKKPLDFKAEYLVKQSVRARRKNRYFPIGYKKLNSENNELFNIIFG